MPGCESLFVHLGFWLLFSCNVYVSVHVHACVHSKGGTHCLLPCRHWAASPDQQPCRPDRRWARLPPQPILCSPSATPDSAARSPLEGERRGGVTADETKTTLQRERKVKNNTRLPFIAGAPRVRRRKWDNPSLPLKDWERMRRHPAQTCARVLLVQRKPTNGWAWFNLWALWKRSEKQMCLVCFNSVLKTVRLWKTTARVTNERQNWHVVFKRGRGNKAL